MSFLFLNAIVFEPIAWAIHTICDYGALGNDVMTSLNYLTCMPVWCPCSWALTVLLKPITCVADPLWLICWPCWLANITIREETALNLHTRAQYISHAPVPRMHLCTGYICSALRILEVMISHTHVWRANITAVKPLRWEESKKSVDYRNKCKERVLTLVEEFKMLLWNKF